jgi:hypothetical protein
MAGKSYPVVVNLSLTPQQSDVSRAFKTGPNERLA